MSELFGVGSSPSSAEARSSIVAKETRRKLSLLEMATELDNASRACKVMRYSRPQYWENGSELKTYGAEDLVVRFPGVRAPTYRTLLRR